FVHVDRLRGSGRLLVYRRRLCPTALHLSRPLAFLHHRTCLFFLLRSPPPPPSPLFPYTTLFRSPPPRLPRGPLQRRPRDERGGGDRKSTRLNSSHGSISYAVFCLKKKSVCTCSPAQVGHHASRRPRAPTQWGRGGEKTMWRRSAS